MKAKNFFKRFVSIVSVLTMSIMTLSTSVCAEDIASTNTDVVAIETANDISPRDITSRTVTYYINVPDWALARTLRIYTGNPYTNSGVVFVYLYNPNGKLISNDWMMGINDSASWTVWNVGAGQYTCKLVMQQDAGNTIADVTFN